MYIVKVKTNMTEIKNNQARQVTPATFQRLCMLSGNECAMPNCQKKLIAEDGITKISKVCHIEAASEGGSRFNASMTDDQRRGFDNLILLCDEHHSIIDNKENEEKYPVDLLKEWKRTHESKMIQKKLEQNPSLLVDAINEISKINLDENSSSISKDKSFKIEEKIAYNNVIRYRSFIDEYKVYSGKIENIYREMDRAGSKKAKLLRNIKHIYLRVKSNYSNGGDDIASVRENADNILDEVEKMLISMFTEKDSEKKVFQEDIEVAIIILMVDAFIRCKILENPSK